MQVASRLIRAHIPFGVITKKKLDQLDRFKVLVLANVHMMDAEECEVIRDWVRRGGKLIATGGSSLVNKQGKKLDDFMLGDVFGVHLVNADWTDRIHYLMPTKAGLELLPEFNADYPAYCAGCGFDVERVGDAQLLAVRGLPWPRKDSSRFSSIHSDPPWIKSDQPELVEHPFGDGMSIYSASLIELLENAESLLVNMVRRLNPEFRFEIGAPGCVEATLFEQPDRKRYLFSLLNFQKELPNLPIDAIHCKLRLPCSIREVRHLPTNAIVATQRNGDAVEFESSKLNTLLMYALLW